MAPLGSANQPAVTRNVFRGSRRHAMRASVGYCAVAADRAKIVSTRYVTQASMKIKPIYGLPTCLRDARERMS